MFMDTIKSWRPHTLLVTLPLATLMLFTSGCSDREPQDAQQTESQEPPAAQTAIPEPIPPASDIGENDRSADEAAEEEISAGEAGEADMSTGEAGEADMSAGEAGEADIATGESVYQKACVACHAAGIAGAPKLGDQAAWAPRIAKGHDVLLESVTKGLNAMPPKGGCISCSDQELHDALAYIVSKSS